LIKTLTTEERVILETGVACTNADNCLHPALVRGIVRDETGFERRFYTACAFHKATPVK
jgi:hypothetical protein